MAVSLQWACQRKPTPPVHGITSRYIAGHVARPAPPPPLARPSSPSPRMSWLSDLLHAGGTGGLNWHWHARASRQRWQPTSSALADFLRTVPVDGQHLLVLGASAGWMMPTEWLLRCARVDTVDIDPLAPHLFGWRHGRALTRAGVRWHHHRLDALAHLDDLLQRFPEAWLWFDNLLGQHRYRLRDAARAERELQALAPRLSGRHWGSVHDVYSGASPLTGSTCQWTSCVQRDWPASALDDAFGQALLQRLNAQGVWSDHGTRGVLPAATPCWLMPWEFRPGHWHWLQAGWVSP